MRKNMFFFLSMWKWKNSYRFRDFFFLSKNFNSILRFLFISLLLLIILQFLLKKKKKLSQEEILRIKLQKYFLFEKQHTTELKLNFIICRQRSSCLHYKQCLNGYGKGYFLSVIVHCIKFLNRLSYAICMWLVK